MGTRSQEMGALLLVLKLSSGLLVFQDPAHRHAGMDKRHRMKNVMIINFYQMMGVTKTVLLKRAGAVKVNYQFVMKFVEMGR